MAATKSMGQVIGTPGTAQVLVLPASVVSGEPLSKARPAGFNVAATDSTDGPGASASGPISTGRAAEAQRVSAWSSIQWPGGLPVKNRWNSLPGWRLMGLS